jgi:hypothetical protein
MGFYIDYFRVFLAGMGRLLLVHEDNYLIIEKWDPQ